MSIDMRYKPARVVIIAVMILIMSSCNTIHEYPDDNPIDPTLVQMTIKLNLANKNFDPFTYTRATDEHDIRYITEVYAIGGSVDEFIARKITISNAPMSDILIDFTLQARKYVFLVWIDYVKKGNPTDLHYDTQESLLSVKIKRPYSGSTDIKDAFAASTQIDLRSYGGQWNVTIEKEIDLIRPLAKFEIIATDIEQYVESLRYSSTPTTISKVEFSYLPRVAVQYNVMKLKPEYFSNSEVFTSNAEYISDKECRLAFDYIFMNGDQSNVQVKLDIYDQNNRILNSIENIQIPIKRNSLTTYKGEFLTRNFNSGGGIGIDYNFEDEIIYKIGD